MNIIDCINAFAGNLRKNYVELGTAQCLFAIARGLLFHRDITASTNLHPNTVTNLLKSLMNQGFVTCTEFKRPRKYLLTNEGERLVKKLLTLKNDEN